MSAEDYKEYGIIGATNGTVMMRLPQILSDKNVELITLKRFKDGRWILSAYRETPENEDLEAIKQVIKDVADGEMNPYDGIPLDRIREILGDVV